ncbi:MAG: hypothetical protein ACTSV1_06805 [Alphaproteobacteria bacterium]
MTRVMYWNIRDFTINKIANPSTAEYINGVTQAQASAWRNNYIMTELAAAAPDIFVLVEVEISYGGRGLLANGNGLVGCLALLNQFGGNWMMVPPLQTGTKEAVGIFYNGAKLVFSGPNIWPGGAFVTPVAPGTAPPGAYPSPTFDPCFAAAPGRPVPVGAQYNVGVREDQCAGNVNFQWDGTGGTVLDAAIDYGNARAPFMTTFAEIDGGGNFVRDISLFAVHAPARGDLAHPYLTSLTRTLQVSRAMGATETRVIAGDFNYNLFKDDLTMRDGYADVEAIGYQLGLRPLAAAPAPPDDYPGYYTTHIKSQDSAKFWSDSTTTRYYPTYGYGGSTTVNGLYAIDNIFVRNPAPPPYPNTMTVLNGVVGSPYTAHALPDPNVPPGGYPAPLGMTAPPLGWPWQPAPAQQIWMHSTLNQRWGNYRSIYSVSDHLALAMEV